MQRFIRAVRSSVTEQNWFAGLFIALALPDICGALENPRSEVGKRYKDWFNRYMAADYAPNFDADDCFYFRCSCLHQGLGSHEKMKFDKIHFIPPIKPSWVIHKNRINDILQMQIDLFCEDVCRAVEKWANDVKDYPEVQQRMKSLLTIHPTSTIVHFETR